MLPSFWITATFCNRLQMCRLVTRCHPGLTYNLLQTGKTSMTALGLCKFGPVRSTQHLTLRMRQKFLNICSKWDVNRIQISYSNNSCKSRLIQSLTLLPPILLRLYTLPYWSNPPFLIFDIWALWRSGLSARAPECQKLKMVG